MMERGECKMGNEGGKGENVYWEMKEGKGRTESGK